MRPLFKLYGTRNREYVSGRGSSGTVQKCMTENYRMRVTELLPRASIVGCSVDTPCKTKDSGAF